MPTDYREPYVDCDTCQRRADLPTPAGAHYTVGRKILAAQGWTFTVNHAERPLRLLPHTYLWACPECPPVATLAQ
ncbi:hypothetical protein AB0E08_08270 [Streptomyces sp. NPDC048281]|uniref:hypothetical protein n=1 Tax=Streptomyces sp. NPDC048281 TaxID=3154715 RepID=UPI00341D818B